MIGIYKIENLINHKVYVGQSIDLHRRFNEHIRELNNGKHINKHLQSSWNKYGQENFEFIILEQCPQELLTEREQYWITYYGGMNCNNNYNKRDASSKGHLSKETKKKLSKKHKGKTVIITEQTKKKISNSLKGRCPSNKGKHCTQNTKLKISKALKGIKKGPMKESTKQKLSELHKGKTAWNKGLPNPYKGIKLPESKKEELRHRHAKLKGISVKQFDLNGNFMAEFESTMEAQRQTGVTNSNIGACLRGNQKTAGGYIWKRG